MTRRAVLWVTRWARIVLYFVLLGALAALLLLPREGSADDLESAPRPSAAEAAPVITLEDLPQQPRQFEDGEWELYKGGIRYVWEVEIKDGRWVRLGIAGPSIQKKGTGGRMVGLQVDLWW